MGYSDNESMVRGDWFTANGKWKYTEALDMTGLYFDTCGLDVEGARRCAYGTHDPGTSLHDSIFRAWHRLHDKRPDRAVPYTDLTLVVLEPCHEHAHPVMMKWPSK